MHTLWRLQNEVSLRQYKECDWNLPRVCLFTHDYECLSAYTVRLNALNPHLQHFARAGLNDAELFVLAAGGQQAPLCVKWHTENHVCVAVNHFHRLPNLQIPNQDLQRDKKHISHTSDTVFVAVWHSHVHSSQLLIIKINFHMQSNCPHCPCFNFVAQFIEFEAVAKYFITL